MTDDLVELGTCGPIKPRLIVDQREKTPLVFKRLPSTVGLLVTGDYSIAGAESLFAVERKALRDLLACSTGRERERFERGLQRLRGYQFRRLLVIGADWQGLTKTAWHFVLGAEMRFDVPVVWTPNADQAATQVERWAMWFARENVATARNIVRASQEQAGNGISDSSDGSSAPTRAACSKEGMPA